VLKAIEINNIVRYDEALGLLEGYDGGKAKFEEFHKDLVGLMEKIAE
jgi:hypothetical protein